MIEMMVNGMVGTVLVIAFLAGFVYVLYGAIDGQTWAKWVLYLGGFLFVSWVLGLLMGIPPVTYLVRF